MFVPRGARIAGTEPDSYFVPTVGVDNGENTRWGSKGARVAVMSKVANKSERMEGGSVEKPIPPVLRVE